MCMLKNQCTIYAGGILLFVQVLFPPGNGQWSATAARKSFNSRMLALLGSALAQLYECRKTKGTRFGGRVPSAKIAGHTQSF